MDIENKYFYVKPFKKEIFTSKSIASNNLSNNLNKSFSSNVNASKTNVSLVFFYEYNRLDF
jgi:hypothetical protein